jgi:hypothetical protein
MLVTLVGITNLPAQLTRDTHSRLSAKQLYNSTQSIMGIPLAVMALRTLVISGCTSIPYTSGLYEEGSANCSPVENVRESIAGWPLERLKVLPLGKLGPSLHSNLKMLVIFEGKPVNNQQTQSYSETCRARAEDCA